MESTIMQRPSAHWTTWNEKRDPKKAGLYLILIQAIGKIRFGALCDRATAVRAKTNGGTHIPCRVDKTVYQAGWFNVVFEIEFEDGVYWIARFQLAINDFPSDESRVQLIRSEFYSMKYIKHHTKIPIPEVFDFNDAYGLENNPVGVPYIMMKALDGRAIIGKFEEVIPRECQDKVLSQLADYRDQLAALRFPKIGRLDATESPEGLLEYTIKPVLNPAGCHWRQAIGPFDTAIDYFFTTRKLDYEETVCRLPNDTDECFAAWVRWQAAVASVNLNFNRGPFPLHHLDLRLPNILFDAQFNVVGIVDWSYVMTVPVEVLANLQQDLGSKYCRRNFIKFLTLHETRRDPGAPYANYFASREPAITSIFPLQEFTSERKDRMRVASELFALLYGKNAKWEDFKRAWLNTSLYKVPERDSMDDAAKWLWRVCSVTATLAVLFVVWVRLFNGIT
jgi:Phosphotransferase enzyme family